MSFGEQLIDLVYIDDVVMAFIIAAEKLIQGNVTEHERYAVSSGTPISLKEVVEMYLRITGKKVIVNWGEKPYRFREVMSTWTNGKPIQGWSPKISLQVGFQYLVEPA